MLVHSWLGALLLGVILLLVGNNLAQPVPLNTLEVWAGWILVVVALVLLLFGGIGGGGWGYGRRWR